MGECNIEVDRSDNVIGMRPREDFYTGNYIHRSVHLILFNSRGEILIQKRAPTKVWFPNLYTYSVSGTVAKESYNYSIRKEVQEEIGLSIEMKFLFKYLFLGETSKSYNAVYSGKSDNKITPDLTEMSKVKWVPTAELEKDITLHPEMYTPTFRMGMKKFFDEYYTKK